MAVVLIKIMMVRPLLALTLLSLGVCRGSGNRAALGAPRVEAGYAIVQRRAWRQGTDAAPTAAPLLPSFDGDLDAILDLALEKAVMTDPALATSPSVAVPEAPTASPPPTTDGDDDDDGNNSLPSGSRQSCVDADTAAVATLLEVFYTYALETAPDAQPGTVAVNSERVLAALLAPSVLACLNSDAAPAGVVALDARPRDAPSNATTCEPRVNAADRCTVWGGRMRFRLADGGDADAARGLILAALQVAIDGADLVDGVMGLVDATFLDPNDPTASVKGPPTQQQEDVDSSGLGRATVVLVSFGSAAVLLLVGSVYYWQHSRGRSDASAFVFDATTMSGWDSSAVGGSKDAARSPPEGPAASPASLAGPGAYMSSSNLSFASGEQSGMSAIAEEEASSSMDNSSAIIMSDSGFSTDTDSLQWSLDVGKSNYSPHVESPLLLGARARNPTVVTAGLGGEESDSDLSSDFEGNFRSATPIPATGALDAPGRDGLLDAEAGLSRGGLDESAEDELLLFKP